MFDKIIERVQSIKTGSGPVLGLAIKLIKTHLPHHVPSVKTLERLDQFCINMGAEHLPSTNMGKVRSETIVGKLYLRTFSLQSLHFIRKIIRHKIRLTRGDISSSGSRKTVPSFASPSKAGALSLSVDLVTSNGTNDSDLLIPNFLTYLSSETKPLQETCMYFTQFVLCCLTTISSVDVDTLEADAIFCDGLSSTFPSNFFSD